MSHDDPHYYVDHGEGIDDPHVYDNGVLINTKSIRDTSTLNEFEATMSELRSIEIFESPIEGTFGLAHAKAVHKHLFQDVYPWAGSIRETDIGKGGTVFLNHGLIIDSFKKVDDFLVESSLLIRGEHDLKSFSEKAGIYLGMVNFIHPFREGNGRTQRHLLSMLAYTHGIEINWRPIGKEAMRSACIEAEIDPTCRKLGRLIMLSSSLLQESQATVETDVVSRALRSFDNHGLDSSSKFFSQIRQISKSKIDFEP